MCWLFNIQSPTSRLVRWALRLQEYTLQIVHKAVQIYGDGDCLSRYPPEENEGHQLNALELDDNVVGGHEIVEKHL